MMELPASHLHVLRLLDRRVAGMSQIWALTGSTSFALQGMPITPHDIDVQTDRAGAFAIEQRLAEYMTRPVRLRESERTRSYFGQLLIDGLRVEIMGDIQHRHENGDWCEPPDLLAHITYARVDSMRIPVLALSYEVEAYKKMGRRQRAAQLAAWLAELRDTARIDQT